jgi:hypothetical protein
MIVHQCNQFLPALVEFLGERSFLGCTSLSSLPFEPGWKLARIEAEAGREIDFIKYAVPYLKQRFRLG